MVNDMGQDIIREDITDVFTWPVLIIKTKMYATLYELKGITTYNG